jgi:hypothetical protein
MLKVMFLLKKQEQSVDDFWREYEEKTGAKVLAKTMGQYLSGWDEFDNPGGAPGGRPLWGLVVVNSLGFRFHHYFRENWLSALIRTGAGEKEKTFFIPREDILSSKIHVETKWWKKIISPALPLLRIQYRINGSAERELLIQLEHTIEGLEEALRS